MSKTLDLAIDLVQRASITPKDEGCQTVIADYLQPLGFEIEHLRFGDVDNLWARRGETAPLFVFAGHTDVVPTGNLDAWQFPPFAATQQEGFLYGRGTADMKGSIAAMLVAVENFVHQHPQHLGSIGFLITSDEEGPSVDGTVKVVEHLQARQEVIDYCVIGEPTSVQQLGDMVKTGRRGSLSGHLTIHGTQGHVAYPHLSDNPIHRFASVLNALCQMSWDMGNEFFPPTTFQVSNIHAGTGANNVIPGELHVDFNFRYSTEVTAAALQNRVTQLLESHSLRYTLNWENSGMPFLTRAGNLVQAVRAVIQDVCKIDTTLSTTGGTSDGRFIAPTGAQVLELGPINATIHKINESVKIADLDTLTTLYQQILQKLLM
jgi:succinyl-diaminopimelate desuccinylase